jgi:hypothetical protein
MDVLIKKEVQRNKGRISDKGIPSAGKEEPYFVFMFLYKSFQC